METRAVEEMIRVLHYGLSTNTGGIETYIQKLWNNINKFEFHFDFIDETLAKPSFHDEFIEMGSKFYKITPRSISMSKNKKDLKDLFENETFDIVHCHLNTLSYVQPILAALKFGSKVIVHSRSSSASNSLMTNSLHHLHSLTLPKNKIKMIAVSDLAGKWLFGKSARFETLNNGIDIEKFRFNKEKRRKIRNELNIDDQFVLGHVGAFLPVKNHKFIIRVFNELRKYRPNSALILIGKGPMEEEIIQLVKDMGIEKKVIFLGRRADISDLLSGMDCFLFPSVFEGFPNAVLEAQCSGLPCLISDTITSEVAISKNCIRIPLNLSVQQWVTNILNITTYKDRSCGSDILKNYGFSVEEEINKIESIYKSVLYNNKH